MQVTEAVLERLVKVYLESGMSKKGFGLSIGHSRSSITEIFKGRTKNISGATVKILELRYAVNPIWLETGLGKPYNNKLVITKKDSYRLIALFRKLAPESQKLLLSISHSLVFMAKHGPPNVEEPENSNLED